jgi:hypothetical protein
MNINDIPFFRSGTGLADWTYGSGEIWIDEGGHMHLDWGGRLLPCTDGGGKILVHAIYSVEDETPALPYRKDIYMVLRIGQYGENTQKITEYECFILSF